MYRNRRLILILSFLLIAGFLFTSLASFFVSRASLRSQISRHALPLTSDNIYSEIQRDLLLPIYISSLMATDTFLRDWVVGGEIDATRITRYLKDIQLRYNTFTSFFVSDRTRNYYQSEGILKKVDPGASRDIWYFRVKSMKSEYEINVDFDMAHHDTVTIFVNYRVYDDHRNYIGATGVGLAVTAVKQLIESYQRKFDRNIYFVDRKGAVTLCGASFPADITNIRQIHGLEPLRDRIFGKDSSSLRYERDGKTIYLNTRYIPEFDWYLLVEQTDETVMKGILNTLFINLLICLLITIVVLMVTHITITSYQKQMEDMAATDMLTGFLNRKAFDIIFEQTIRDSRRNGAPLSIIMFDIDRFKRINDTFGHPAGDAVISKVAELSRSCLRDSDVACRWGGEEFLILLKGCGIENAFNVSGKILTLIENTAIEYETKHIMATISLGVTEYRSDETKEDMIKRADDAMYLAKRNGRNRSERIG